MYLKILYKLRYLGCISKQDKRCTVKNTWLKSSKSIFLAESFFYSTQSYFPFLTASLVHFSSYYAKKTLYGLYGRWFAGVHEEKSSCINYSEKIITSCTGILARAPSRRVGSTTGALRHLRLEIEPNHYGDRPFANPVGRSPQRFAQERDSPRLWGKVLQQIPCHSRGQPAGCRVSTPQDGP